MMVNVVLTCRLNLAQFFRQLCHRQVREEELNTIGLGLLLYALISLCLRLVSRYSQVQEATIQRLYFLTSSGFVFLPKFDHIFQNTSRTRARTSNMYYFVRISGILCITYHLLLPEARYIN